MAAEEIEEKKTPFCRVGVGDKESVLRFSFGNLTNVDIDLTDLSEDISSQLLVHGLTQKGRDSFAGAGGNFEEAIGSVTKVFDNLLAGNWTASRASAGDSKPRTTELAEAIANLKGLSLESVQKAVEAATDDQRKAWRKNPAVSAEVLNIRAAKAKARADKAKADGQTLEIAGL